MTTIACDGRSIAADGRITDDNGMKHSDTYVKVFQLDDGRVVGYAGEPFQEGPLLRFLNGVTDSLELGDNFEALILGPDGKCYCMNGSGMTYEQPTPAVAGSGSSYAMTAMLCGHDAESAVRMGIMLDAYSGGQITVLTPK